MSILNYFRRTSKPADNEDLPDPNGSLSKEVPSSAIAKANALVSSEIEKRCSKERGPYLMLTPAQKFEIGRRASEHGVTSALHYFSKKFPDLPLKETSVRRLKNLYRENLKKPGGDNSDNVQELMTGQKIGRPLILGDDLDRQVREYVKYLRERGCVVNTAVVIAAAEGIVMNKNANLLSCNGGGILLTKDWAKYLLKRLGMVKRKANTKAKVTVEDFEAAKEQFLLDIKNVVSLDEIPPALILNWDQTGINYVPVSSWTMESEGAKRVELAGKDDKRQITAVFGCSLVGDFLPPQLIYQGKTTRCLPQVEVPPDWHITYYVNHWSNESTMKDYVEKIIIPYIQKKREELNVLPDHRALLLFDNFKAQCTTPLLQILDNNDINVLLIPPNCTDRLQPLDISVNKAAKEFLRGKFQKWYAQEVCSQFQSGERIPIDLRMSVVKPLGLQWMIGLYDYLKSKPDIIQNGFKDIKDYLD